MEHPGPFLKQRYTSKGLTIMFRTLIVYYA